MLTIHFRDGREVRYQEGCGFQTVSDWIHLRDRDKDIIGIVRLADVSAIHFGHPAAKTEQEQQISIAPLMEIPA